MIRKNFQRMFTVNFIGLGILTICIGLNSAKKIYAYEKNLVINGGFELDVNHDGVPDTWKIAGSKEIKQSLKFGKGRSSGHSARVICSKYVDTEKKSHVMLFQQGTISIKKGEFYKLTFWAKQSGMKTGSVSVALRDSYRRKECGLNQMFELLTGKTEWEKFTFIFKASYNCSNSSRLQFWYRETGTVWFDDVEMVVVKSSAFKPGNIIPTDGCKNLIPNSSFECGTTGWGSLSLTPSLPWHGGLDRLIGELDTSTAFHGQTSMKIELRPETTPVYNFDSLGIIQQKIMSPLLGSVGWIRVKKGEEYTLSMYLKSQEPEMIARLGIYNFMLSPETQTLKVSKSWNRYSIVIKPLSDYVFVMVGPDMKKAKLDHGILWVDCIQFEAGAKASNYKPSKEVEIGVCTEKLGNIFTQGNLIQMTTYFQNSSKISQNISCDIELFDFFDRKVKQKSIKRMLIAGTTYKERINLKEDKVGFFTVRITMHWSGGNVEKKNRIAVIPQYKSKDSVFGINHAYAWPHALKLCSAAGIKWFRDWSLRWQDVEPEKGKFNFSRTDAEIDRLLKENLNVLGLLPFPSNNWSSSAPPYITANKTSHLKPIRMSYAPKNVYEFKNYVKRTLQHYKGKIEYWQIFNEPLSNYSLPRKYGYKSTDYVFLLQAAWDAAKEIDSKCKILAGFRGLGSESILKEFMEFFEAGGLNYCDAITIHCYPRVIPPEYFDEPLKKINLMMEEYGHKKPIWLTEHGYYADDDPSRIPPKFRNVTSPLRNEIVQASYEIRFSVILLANGVKKIFFHMGNTTKLNRDNIAGIFFEYGGRPRKIYPAVAAFNLILSHDAIFIKKMSLGNEIWAYLFKRGNQLVLVVWKPTTGPPNRLILSDTKINILDIMSNQILSRRIELTSTPVYLVTSSLTEQQFEASLKIDF